MAHILSCPSLGIFTYINPHTISFTSPIFKSGARDNIFHNSHNTLVLVEYTSALFSSLALTDYSPPAPLYRGPVEPWTVSGGQTAPRVRDLCYRRRALHLRRLPVRRISNNLRSKYRSVLVGSRTTTPDK